MPYIEPADLRLALSNVLKITPDQLPAYWDDVCDQAATFALAEIKGKLLRRGFLDTGAYDLDDWDRAFEFSRDLGLWKSILLGGVYAGFDHQSLASFDRRAELDEVLVYINGVWIQPTGNYPSLTSCGERDDSGGGLFGRYPCDCDRSDECMRW